MDMLCWCVHTRKFERASLVEISVASLVLRLIAFTDEAVPIYGRNLIVVDIRRKAFWAN